MIAMSSKENLSVPPDFEKVSKEFFTKKTIAKREFVDFCIMAIKSVEQHWDKRTGIAYHICGAWLSYDEDITDDPLLDEIGGMFGTLELPDALLPDNPEKEWAKVKKLVKEADKTII